MPHIQFIPPSVCHTLHQVLPNHFCPCTSLTSKCKKFSPTHPFKHVFFTKFKLLTILAPQLSSDLQKLNHLTQVFWHRQWKHNITFMYFLTTKFLHFSPNTICDQFKNKQRAKKLHTPQILKNQHAHKLRDLKKSTCAGKSKAHGSPTVAHAMPQSWY